jgi:hypothetical protein
LGVAGSFFYPLVKTRLGTAVYVAFWLADLALIVWIVYDLRTRAATPSYGSVWVLLFIAAGCAHTAWCHVNLKRFARRLIAADFRLCGRCGSPVEGESGRCAACGAKFDVAKTRRIWEGWRGKLARKAGIGPTTGR